MLKARYSSVANNSLKMALLFLIALYSEAFEYKFKKKVG